MVSDSETDLILYNTCAPHSNQSTYSCMHMHLTSCQKYGVDTVTKGVTVEKNGCVGNCPVSSDHCSDCPSPLSVSQPTRPRMHLTYANTVVQ
jgi:hypothetical protein